MAVDSMRFTFSDLISGYVTNFDESTDHFGQRTDDGREFTIKLANPVEAELLSNLDEPRQGCTEQMQAMLTPGRFVYAYGIFYPEEAGPRFEAKHLAFVGQTADEWRFEAPDWWIRQIRAIADFYFKAQWPDGNVDFRRYRTHITLEGQRIEERTRQETDTISRAVYGWATAYLLTGEDRYLEAAEKGSEYLREHMRASDPSARIVYWYHAIDWNGERLRKFLASQFGEDYDAIPVYEQIYALAGPTQTYRITGDSRIREDIDRTVALLDRYFLDRERGGYFSHVDPVTFDPRAESLGQDRARKNWNSIGDHIPAYLINLWLATNETVHADRLAYLADIIVEHFPDDEHSPFVQERFHEDWAKDQTWEWQQNRALIGHNLKIAWNLMRINSLRQNDRYEAMAKKIASVMPAVGSDRQRGGWYDSVERERAPGEAWHRFSWHDRKAWWQQEQAILAYLILHGCFGDPEHLRMARQSAAFYNTWFLDHDNGGVYFNVLPSGIPFLVGTERLKGSHSMSLYHSTELCYLAAVYTNLLIRKEPMDLYFKPKPGAWKANLLRVAPDILPAGQVRLDAVWVNGEPYDQFDPGALTVTLPPSSDDLRVRVRVAPVNPAETFYSSLEMTEGVAKLTMSGQLAPSAVYMFEAEVNRAVAQKPSRLVLIMNDLDSISQEAVRVLVFASGHLNANAEIYGIGASVQIVEAFRELEFDEEIIWLSEYDAATIER